MKKILSAILTLVVLFSFTGCTVSESTNSRILKIADGYTIPASTSDIEVKFKDDYFIIDNKVSIYQKDEESISSYYSLDDEIDNKAVKIALAKVKNYVRQNPHFFDTKKVLKKLKGTKLFWGDTKDPRFEYPNVVVIPSGYKIMDEIQLQRIMIHELIHAVSYYNSGKKVPEEYNILLREVITDIIANNIWLSSNKGAQSEYEYYYSEGYLFLKVFQQDGINSIFVNFSNLEKVASKDEIMFYSLCMENLDKDKSFEYIERLLIKWQKKIVILNKN